MTPTQIINAALSALGVIAPGNDPATEDATYALDRLNDLLDAWALERRYVYVMNHNSFTFSASQQSYTIGPASSTPNFTAPRPVWIERANLVLTDSSPDTHIPLEVINTNDYAALAVPALSSDIPSRLYYQPTVTKGTLWPWPYPTVTSNQLELFTWNQLAQIASADVGTDYPLPPGYRKALILSLAEEMVLAFGKTNTEKLEADARKARAAIAGINTAPPNMDVSWPSGSVRYGASRSDFLSGWFR